MDTVAYLTNQGWRGDGHALHHSGRGITKPIHISQKQNVFGVGKIKHDAHADQWWARAFDATLKGLNGTKDEVTGRTEGISLGTDAQALQMVGKGGPQWVGQRGLYSNFVKGESLGGTLTPEEGRKLESKEQDEDWEVSEGDSLERIAARQKKKKSRRRQDGNEALTDYAKASEQAVTQGLVETEVRVMRSKINPGETKEERRQRRKERRARKALEENVPTKALAVQTEADMDEQSSCERVRRRKKEKRYAAARVESAISEDVKPNVSRSKISKKRKRELAATENR